MNVLACSNCLHEFYYVASVERQHEMKLCGRCRQMDGTVPEGMRQSWGSL